MKIILAAHDPNEKGDLFTDRMKDLVHALGYETQYVNVHKPGRELDIHARHRVEDRQLVVECKAHATPISGADLNKFAGALQAEKEQNSELVGYFISLSGFKDSALVQEEQFSKRRFETMGPLQIAEQLMEGRVIVRPSVASFAVAKLPALPAEAEIGATPDLILHRTGWIWAVHITRAGKVLGTALVHANGQLLDASIANRVSTEMKSLDPKFRVLMPPDEIEASEEQAESSYVKYLVEEFGSLTLEGLPVDQYASSSVHSLEEMYIPLYLEIPRREYGPEAAITPMPGTPVDTHDRVRLTLAQTLQDGGKIAILAAPGSGKSTLVRRLAVAYADPGRRSKIQDSLPNKQWFPLVIRGRDVQRIGVTAVLDVLYDIPRKAEINSRLHEPFKRLLSRKLQTGTALLLVDGLDEIAVDSDRRLFAHQLRTFVSMYPEVSLVITSREAGFRLVAGEISTYCTVYDLGELDDNDIGQLIELWYAKVPALGQVSSNQASEVTDKVLSNDRVRRLAGNPLLLTTLLYVQRWAGEIPKRRVLLYDRATDLLLMTWNVEGHAPLRIEEALPQLAYLAFGMMNRKTQRISSSEAEASFIEAREAMPEVLAYSSETPHDMINRVESRSSLLMLAGYGIEDGRVETFYEFRHLAFQEYLAGLAIAKEWCYDSSEGSAIDVLRPHFVEPSWSEVIALSSVLLGRRGGLLIEALLETLDEYLDGSIPSREDDNSYDEVQLITDTMYSCVVDEAQMRPEQARTVIGRIIELGNIGSAEDLLAGRYGALVADVIWSALGVAETSPDFGGSEYFWVAADVVVRRADRKASQLEDVLNELCESADIADQLAAMSVITRSAYRKVGYGDSGDAYQDVFLPISEIICNFADRAIEILEKHPGNILVWGCGCWMLSWAETIFNLDEKAQLRIGPRVVETLFQTESAQASYYAGWLLSSGLRNILKSLVKDLNREQVRAVHKIIENVDPTAYSIRNALGIAALAAVDTNRFGRQRVLDFCDAHRMNDDRWEPIIALARERP